MNGCKIEQNGPKCCTVEIPEKQLYRTLLEVTHYKSRGLKLMDYEDTDIVVDEQFTRIADIYRPLLNNVEPFKDYIKLIEPTPATPLSEEKIIEN
jgi:hypothetical protein